MIKTILSLLVLIIVLVIIGFVTTFNSKSPSSNDVSSIEIESGHNPSGNMENENKESNGTPGEIVRKTEREDAFSKDGLKTNTAIRSIPLKEVLGGGPGKDGIPAIFNPKFISVNEAKKIENGDRFGVVVTVGNTFRFYPYSILVWHEIVNDLIDEENFVVTFCPLCGSAIVFDPTVDGEIRKFGVSGKLWESNLLMYDHKNENLWSQIIGEAVVGDDTGKKLKIFPSQIITFSEFASKYPNGEVLSRDTGYTRNYGFYPYGDYDNSENLYFPVSVKDSRLPAKEIMVITNLKNIDGKEVSVAFKRSDVIEKGTATKNIGSEANPFRIVAHVKNGGVVIEDEAGNEFPSYVAMWFSWAAHHQDDGFVWVSE